MELGLIGCGRWGALILRDLRALGAEVSVLTRDGSGAANARAGGGRVVGSVDDLRGCAGVVVAVPSVSHASVIDSVLPLGVPVFVEKPMTVDVESARRFVASAGDRVFVMDKWRYHPGVRRLSELAASGALGEIQGIHLVRVQHGNPHTDVDTSWILLPHDLAIARDVLGALPEPRLARAVTTGSRVEAMYAVLGDSPWCHIEISSIAAAAQRRVEVFGTDGIGVLDDGWADHVSVYRTDPDGGRRIERIEATGELPLLAELRAFVEHLEGGPPPRSSAAEGLEVVEAISTLRSLAGVR